MIQTLTFRLLAILFVSSLALVGCKNDPPATEEVSDEEAAPPTRERKGPIIPFEVYDQSGKPVEAYRVFESFPDGASGTVFQFQHGYASIPFETEARYQIQADGYHNLDLEFTALDSLKRAIFYMHRKEQNSGAFSVGGSILKRDMRPFGKVAVKAGTAQGQTNADGVYAVDAPSLNENEPFPLEYQWRDEQGRDLRLGLIFRGLRQEALRVDLVLGVDVKD